MPWVKLGLILLVCTQHFARLLVEQEPAPAEHSQNEHPCKIILVYLMKPFCVKMTFGVAQALGKARRPGPWGPTLAGIVSTFFLLLLHTSQN